MLYVLAGAMGFVLGLIYMSFKPSKFEASITKHLMEGKTVVICVGQDALIFNMVGNRLQVSKATTTMMEEEDASHDLDSFGPDQSDTSH